MKQQFKRKQILGYLAATLAFALVLGGVGVAMQPQFSAIAEPVAISESATVVQSPFTAAVNGVRDSVVGVNNYTTVSRNNNFYFGYGYGFGGRSTPPEENTGREVLQGSGSGVVIANGYVLTNYHVVEGSTSLEITAGEETYAAVLAGHDESLDLAMLRVESLELKPVVLGDSDVLNVGDWAICIGNPLSFTGTTTVGVISALNREITNASTDVYGRRTEIKNAMIQTDAAINSGNSGGGMFNVAGELIGIPSMKYTGSYYSRSTVEGIGMAIPVNAAKPLIEDVLSGKAATEADTASDSAAIASAGKPRIGVSVSNVNTSNPAFSMGLLPRGAIVTDVEAGSPAEKAGLQVDDIVVEVDGTIITSTSQMVGLLQAKQVGETAAVKIYRVEGLGSIENIEDIPEGQYMDLQIELALLDNVKQ